MRDTRIYFCLGSKNCSLAFVIKKCYDFNMKNIKIRVIDDNTLELAENANSGDRIDLKSIHEIDIDKSSISSALNKKIELEKQNAVEKERERLLAEKENEARALAKQNEMEKQMAIANKEKELKDRYKEENRDLEKTVNKLLAEKQSLEKEQDTKIKMAILQKDREYDAEKSRLEKELELEKFKMVKIEENKDKEIQAIKDKKEIELANKETYFRQQIEIVEQERDRWKEHQHSLSIKDFGNSLEEYCDNVFADIQTFLPNATFCKDTVGETMGDRIYRELDDKGNEVLTIMFEMKDERDNSKTKTKNKDHFAKLDKDRKNKSCEYAVLVSLLETDTKIYDAPFTVREYPKMFVIRPQCFKYIIENLRLIKSELSHANMQLVENKRQNIDIVNFQQNWSEFLQGFGRNVSLAATHFKKLRENKVKQIELIQKEVEELDLVGKNLDLAFKKGEKVDFKKITKDSPSLLLQFSDEDK
jgi:hypothetical protein